MGTNLSQFDYGLVYDNTKLSVEKIAWDSAFLNKYSMLVNISANGILETADLKTHVVLGGVNASNVFYVATNEVFATVTFRVKDGKNTGEILLTDDSAQYDSDFTDAYG